MTLRIAHKISIYVLLVLILPLAATLLLVSQDARARAEAEIRRQAKFSLQVATQWLRRQRESATVRLHFLANEDRDFPAALNAGGDTLAVWLETRRTALGLRWLAVIDRDGRPRSYVGQASGRELPVLRTPPGTLFSSFLFDGAGVGLFAAAPVIGAGATEGTRLVSCQDLGVDALDTLKDMTEMEVSIYPASGRGRAATTRIGADARRQFDGSLPEHMRRSLVSDDFALGEEIFLGRRYLLAAAPLVTDAGRSGYVSVAVPLEAFARTGGLLVNTLYLMGLVSVLLALLAGWLLSRSIARPLGRFARFASEIGEGRYGETIHFARGDEIGQLAESFNEMSVQLKQTMQRLERRMFEVQTLYAVSQSMNFMNNSEQLLNMILERAVAALGAERGSLMLVDPETREMVVSVVSGFSGSLEKRIALKPGEGLAGLALETGVTQSSRDVGNDPRFKSFQETRESEAAIRHILCVPLKTKDQAFGVINMTNKSGGEDFSEDDIRLIEALATQAAVTIENARLYELSITDGMTKLYIHRYFQIRLDEELRRAERYGGEVSLILTDVDHFKKFNDTYGHQTGDLVLVRFAGLIRRAIRQEVDIPCRYGGEEFCIIAPNTGRDEACVMAERLRRMVEEDEIAGPGGQTLKVTISLGISTFPGNTRDKKELILKADTALYHAKENGRNQYHHISDVEAAGGGRTS